MSDIIRFLKRLPLMGLMAILFSFSVNDSDRDATDAERSRVVTEKIGNRYATIYFPPGFEKNSRLKVVYMLDGNAIFDIEPDFEKLLNRLIQKKTIEPIVVVGIHSTHNRTSDLLPYFDKEVVDYGAYRPNASLFSKEIHEVIIPYMQNRYGVATGAENMALFGFSFGGLFTMWEISGNQKQWGMIASSSPSFWVKEYQVYKDIEELGVTADKIWYDIGTAEWNVIYGLLPLLDKAGLTYGVDQFYYEDHGAGHLYGDLLERLHNPLIAFAGSQDYEPTGMELLIEFIPSRRTDNVFKRINPMIKLANGMRYSAISKANYELLNVEDGGEVKADGRFEFNGNEALQVRVTYGSLVKEIRILPKK